MIRHADFQREGAAIRSLIDEYVAWLDFYLCFQNFDDEMRNLATVYGAPAGAFLVAEIDGVLAGCVGLRALADGTCEMKRLYVRPAYQGRGLGRGLVVGLIAFARELGFARIVLDAAPKTLTAQELYKAQGFRETAGYCASPIVGTRFFELVL